MCSRTVDILLLTYSAQAWLGELLSSLEAQTYKHWRIVARDDGSADRSLEILREFAGRHGQRFRLLENPQKRNVGASRGFAALLQASTAPYAMLCDCDDVWLPEKIELTLDRMIQAEKQSAGDTPVLVHTDLTVTDENLKTTAASFYRSQNLRPLRGQAFSRLLIQNCVTGCTCMLNATLRRLALPIPTQAVIHDWWLALVASAFGRIEYIPRATIRYRQHGRNLIGARPWDYRYVLGKLAAFHRTDDLRNTIELITRQAVAFRERYRSMLDARQAATLQACCDLSERPWLARRISILRHGLLKHGLIRNLAWVARV